MSNRLVGIIWTLVVHSTLLLLLLLEVKPTKPPPKPSGSVSVQLLPPAFAQAAKQIATGDQKGAGVLNAADCEGSYRGVGLIYNIFTLVIISAPPGYPAYRAGIRVDDELIVRKGPDGAGWVEYEVLRGEEHLKFRIQQEDICFKEEVEGR